ncbi:MAG: T9SS type A sorting domain-containing protein [Bacteroidia bacterium]|nr:T9SS type A sorting domain-containing protein [Bacteroidia bacterium]
MKLYKFLSVFVLFLIFHNCNSQDLIPNNWHNLTGYWKFQNTKNITKATVGNDLFLIGNHTITKGPSYDDTAIRIGIGSYYKCKHNISPNGGGDSVNRYTMMFDFKILSLKKWHTFFQTDSTNSNDGECFIRPNTGKEPGRIGTAATGYTKDSVFPNKWYRLVISVNNGNFYRYYLNGKLILEGDTQDIDDRFALTPKVLFFGDNDQEDDTIDVASVAIFDTCLSSKDIEKIGTIEPCIARAPKVNLGNDTVLCLNSFINLNAGNGYSKYQWSNGSGLPFNYISGTSLGLGKKNVWVKITDKNGCTASDTIGINVLSVPKVELGKDTSICEGNSITLSGGTDMSNSYYWKNLKNGSFISIKNTITVDSTGNYHVKVSDNFGCEAEDSIQINFYKNPSKPKISVSGNTSFCKGDSVKLIGQAGYANYLWSNGKNNSEIIIKENITISLKVSDKNSCTSMWSDSLKITVFENPKPPQISVLPDTTFCKGDSVKLSVADGFKEYYWNTGDSQNIITIKQGGWFYLFVKDTNGCKSSLSKTVNIYALETPEKQEINVIGNKEFCSGDSTLLYVKNNFISYLWNNGKTSDTITVYKQDSYKVKVKNIYGCYSQWSNEVFITVNPIPKKPIIKILTNDTLECSVKAENYKWFKNSNELTMNNYKIVAKASGFYKVKIADKNCWSQISDSVFYKKLNISKYNNLREGLVYPNPVEDNLYLKIDENFAKIDEIEIYNLSGIKQIEIKEIVKSKNSVYIKTADLSSGIYYIIIKADNKLQSVKFEKK